MFIVSNKTKLFIGLTLLQELKKLEEELGR